MINTAFMDGLTLSLEIIGRMGLVVFLGYWFIKRNWIDQSTLNSLTKILIDAVIPCVFIASMVRSIDWEMVQSSSAIIFSVLAWNLGSYLVCHLLYQWKPSGKKSEDRAATAMSMVQNGIYLPLPVALALAPEHLKGQAALLVAMAVFPAIVIQWSLGVNLLGRELPTLKDRIRNILNPPMMGLMTGILLSFIPGMRPAALGHPDSLLILRILFSSMDFIGQALSPLAMLLLGAFIASGKVTGRIRFRHILPIILLRLILVPAMVYWVIRFQWIHLTSLAAVILILEAAAPPATNHSVIARRYGGEWELVSALQLIVHIAALFTLPVWIALAMQL